MRPCSNLAALPSIWARRAEIRLLSRSSRKAIAAQLTPAPPLRGRARAPTLGRVALMRAGIAARIGEAALPFPPRAGALLRCSTAGGSRSDRGAQPSASGQAASQVGHAPPPRRARHPPPAL
ncbi:MAG: hypothetical protein RL071_2626 [Pseudomonadota bacterium]|jgi:hypothetical protein